MFNKSITFLQDTKKYFQNKIKKLGYDTCHRTKEYDAKECYKDCKKLEKSGFAKICEKDGGLFKCCIRSESISFSFLLSYLHLFPEEMQNFAMTVDSAVLYLSVQPKVDQDFDSVTSHLVRLKRLVLSMKVNQMLVWDFSLT